jgi:3-O-methylgallate 3,4-dioxygenase
MAELVAAIGTSHAPPVFLAPEYWTRHSLITDTKNTELLSPRTGIVTSYEDLVQEVSESDPQLLNELTPEIFAAKYKRMRAATAELRKTLRAFAPDAVIVLSDDQEEILFDDNMPSFSVFWGESWTLLPWTSPRAAADPLFQSFRAGWGDQELEVPVDTRFGEHLITSLINSDFDVSHFRYLREEYGGSVGPAGYIDETRTRPAKRHGIPHGFGYVVKALMQNDPIPMVPVFLNTCYPPNRPTPRRCYDFGLALRRAIDSYSPDSRFLVIASGGLSHFVLDEELDRMTIRGLENDDRALLESLPRLDTPTGEIRNWVAAAGACKDLSFELVDYVPTPRSPAGTGGGWTFARWLPR